MNTKAASIAERVKILALILVISTMFLGFSMLTGKEVILSVDGVEREVTTFANTVEDLIKSEDVNVEKGAYLSHPLDSEVEDQMEITIQNINTFKVKDAGEIIEISSTSNKVEDILNQGGISLGENDYTYPELEREVQPGNKIRIYRITENLDTSEESIDFKKETVENPNLEKGKERLVQEGQNGVKEITLITKYLNGVELSKETRVEVTKEPVKQIIEVGTKKPKPSKPAGGSSGSKAGASTSGGNNSGSKGSTNLNYKRELIMNATAYDDSYESQGPWVGKTASGMKPQRGVVAVDPRVIPLGTKLYIASTDGSPDYGYAVAGDTGGAIKGNRIDLFHNTRAECRAFGRRNVKVYILN